MRRSVCGVMWPIGNRPSASSCSFARSRIGARMRARTLSGCWRVPLRVGNAGSPWPLGYFFRCAVRPCRSAGTIGTLRSPASDFVADLGTRRRPPATSRCGPSSPQSSETRRPPRISVSMTTRRGTSLRFRAAGAPFQSSPRRTLRISVSETPSSRASETAGRLELRMRSTPAHVSPRRSASIRSAASRTAATCSASRYERRGRSAFGAADFSAGTSPTSTPRFFASRNTRSAASSALRIDPLDTARRRAW